MKVCLYFCLAVLAAGCLFSCKTSQSASVSFSDLDGDWQVVQLNGKTVNPVQAKQVVGIEAATKRLSGNAGCNRMMGQIEYSDAYKNIIKFPHIATTRMACPDMSGERELLDALSKVVRFEAVGKKKPVDEIAFYGVDNTKLMVLKKK